MENSRLQEAVAELRGAGLDEERIAEMLAPRLDLKEPIEVIERQLRYLPYRDARSPGSVLVKAIRQDWEAPAKWVALRRRPEKEEAPKPEENALAYRKDQAPPVPRDEPREGMGEETRAAYDLIRAYYLLPSERVRLPDGGTVRQCLCPGPWWEAQTDMLRYWLGIEPWRNFQGIEGALCLGPWEGMGITVPGRKAPLTPASKKKTVRSEAA
jgi:hypothetical protein